MSSRAVSHHNLIVVILATALYRHKVNWATPRHNNAAGSEKVHENQHLGGRRLEGAPQPGFSAPVTQSADTEEVGAAAQLPA